MTRTIPRGEVLANLLSLGILFLVILAFFWPLILAGQWIPRGGGDLVSFLWPTYRFAARSLRAGVVPLWNPYLYSGAPFVADNQAGVFYPINLLAFAIFGEPSYEVMEALVVFHVWLAGANMFLLGRGLGLGWPAALLGGVAFALSDLFVTHVGNLNLNATAAWLPLLLLLAHRALTRRSPGQAASAGAVLAVAALAGHGQMLLFLVLGLALYLLYRLVVDLRRPTKDKGRRTNVVVAVRDQLAAGGLHRRHWDGGRGADAAAGSGDGRPHRSRPPALRRGDPLLAPAPGAPRPAGSGLLRARSGRLLGPLGPGRGGLRRRGDVGVSSHWLGHVAER